MNTRSDISNYLIHFTKGEDMVHAFENFISIISSRSLNGGTGMIRGGHTCVCFSEAPLSAIHHGLVNENFYSNYSPFGIMVEKKWLYNQGGRPVIYQKSEEYEMLSDQQSWRHVTLDLTKDDPIDFTWEREWRIKTNSLSINEENSSLILPNNEWANNLGEHFEWDERQFEVQHYNLIFEDQLLAELMASPRGHYFDWPMIIIDEQKGT